MSYFGIVIGAPCSGKTAYVEKMRRPGDIVLDLDKLQEALGSRRTHGHSMVLLPFALGMRAAVLRLLASHTEPPNVWYITCWPSPEEQALFPEDAYRVVMSATQDECKDRAQRDGRPRGTEVLIEQWFAAHGQPSRAGGAA